MIHVLLPCCKGDENQAIALLEWIAELGPVSAKFFLLCSDDCQHQRMLEIANKSFASTKWLRDAENLKSDWREIGNHIKSAAGPNSLFRQAAWYFNMLERGPWLFLEPDAIPCHPDWLKDLSEEYAQCGKPFMGFKVTRETHPGDVGEHMSGVAVYHPDTPGIACNGVLAGDTAFDIAGAIEFVDNMHVTQRIYHRYRPPTFSTHEDFDQRVAKHLAIYHACKDGSIFKFLRKRLGMASKEAPLELFVPTPPAQPVQVSSGARTVDIFIKTREHDFPWLEWCLKSISRYATAQNGFGKVIILSETKPQGKFTEFDELGGSNGFSWNLAPDKDPGYLWQQVCKLRADQFTDASFILFDDSDTIFTRPITPDDFIRNGKPIWQYTPLDQARSDQQIWVPVMEKFLGRRPQHEFMRRHPFIVPRWAFEEFRTFCKYRHGCNLEDYIMGQAVPGSPTALVFSEWNCLGFFLWEYHRDKVEWILDADAGPACVYQGFTHGGEARKLEDIANFKELLHDGRETGNSVAGEPQTNGASVLSVVSTPSLTIDSCIEFIANNVKSTIHKARVVRQLKSAWKGKGESIPKRKKAVSAPRKDSLLLAIHSYPGANETFARHWPSYVKSGATRIVGIGTTDHKCEFPCESVEIGRNAYMKMKGKDTHLCQRLIDTVKWCLSQPEDRFIISEYDTIFLRKMPPCRGINAHKTGGQVNGSLTHSFSHNPWIFDRESGPILLQSLNAVLDESSEYPNNSPDLFFGLACERAGITPGCPWKMFTRNSLDEPESLDLAVQAALDGAHVIHGVKRDFEYETIMSALNGKHLELSHQVA